MATLGHLVLVASLAFLMLSTQAGVVSGVGDEAYVLRIFFMVGVRSIPEEYIVKRWTMDEVCSNALDEQPFEPGVSSTDGLAAWYNDLCQNGTMYGMPGAMLPDVYEVAKAALQKAFADVVSAKNQQMT
ncbi:hypothetical protein ACP4OV_013704 [Aristida adscensionis]